MALSGVPGDRSAQPGSFVPGRGATAITPQVVVLGQVTETDAAQVVTKVGGPKTRAILQVTEFDLAQSINRVGGTKIRLVTQAVEADLAQAVVARKSHIVAVGQASETDAAFSVGRFGAPEAPPEEEVALFAALAVEDPEASMLLGALAVTAPIHAAPPLELVVEVKDADGVSRLWRSAGPAADVPQGISFRTKLMDGFADSSLRLARRIDREYSDIGLYDDVRIFGADGAVAYEGYITATPRSMDATHSITIQATGYMAHARDTPFREIYIDRDTSQWNEWFALKTLRAGSFDLEAIGANAGNGGVIFTPPQGSVPNNTLTELVYRMPDGLSIGRVGYNAVDTGVTMFEPAYIFWADSASDLQTGTGTFGQAGPIGVGGTDLLTDVPGRHYAMVRLANGSGSAVAVAAGAQRRFASLAVYGTQALPYLGSLVGVLASDVIIHAFNRYAPKINTAGVQPTTWPIPHLAFRDETDAYSVALEVNKYHLWHGLAVWENRTLHYGPVDLSDYDWEVRLGDPNVRIELAGDTVESTFNGIIVTFRDLSGEERRLTPDTAPDLSDTSEGIPANRHGRRVWDKVELQTPLPEESAIQIGRATLAERNRPKQAGSISVTGHIRDRAGHLQQVWRVRAGSRVAITTHPNDRPRLIVETDYDHERKELTMAVDSTLKRMDALFDRLTTHVTAEGLSV